ncbi:MAG: methionyl-tRNA formyltransferase, partial [Treponema sp.]|nr:methionyl-tRNA formyltransferase [Treponema sp.]
MRVVFAGSPAIAVPALEAVYAMPDVELVAVLTNPDSPKGRHGRSEPTDVGAAAGRLVVKEMLAETKFPILKPQKLDAALRKALVALKPELLVSFAYGHIFGPKFLALFPLGGINIHPSLLPRYRGATPIQAAILHRDHETGLSIQRLAREMDSGDLLYQERIPLSGRETTESLSAFMAAKAVAALPKMLSAIAQGRVESYPQTGDVSYCAPITKDEGRIDWTQSAEAIDAQIRAFTPWPLSWTLHGEQYLHFLEAAPYTEAPYTEAPVGTVLGIDKRAGILVQTGDGVLCVTRLQYRTRKALEWRAFL